ncbi:MAG: DUF4167 domain-containing protein [Alphaproteobacteria bacterium]|nr:DUF4167 domain-containing protein [Alphaproteobacteria bacterium]
MGMNPRGRSRGRNHNNFNNNRRFNNGPNRNTVYDSIGPAGRLRGTAFQLMEKYMSAAKELMSSDRVLAESCLQHADHYMRINALAIAAEGMRFAPQNQPESEPVESVAVSEEQPVIGEAAPLPAEQSAEREPEVPAVVQMDLSVPVMAMAENEMKNRRGRPAMKKDPIQSEEGTAPVPVKRRGRPSKKAVAAEA